MKAREAYEKHVRKQLEDWSAEIDSLKEKAAGTDVEGRSDYIERIGELRLIRGTAAEKLDALNAASDDSWDDLKDDVERALRSLKKTWESVISGSR